MSIAISPACNDAAEICTFIEVRGGTATAPNLADR